MTGDQFREKIGAYQKLYDKNLGEMTVKFNQPK